MSDRLWRKRGPDGQPTGSWYGAYFDAEGTRRLVCTRQLDRQAARKVLRELERKATAPRGAAADPALTVGDALRYLVEESNAKDWAASTLRMFAQKAGHALRLLGGIRLADLRQGDLVATATSGSRRRRPRNRAQGAVHHQGRACRGGQARVVQ